MIVVVCLVYFLAGNFLMNGLLHLMMGLFGKTFVKPPKMVSKKQYETVYSGRFFSSSVCNSLYGLGQIYVALLVLLFLGSFSVGLNAETASLALGITLGTIVLSWKYEGAIA